MRFASLSTSNDCKGGSDKTEPNSTVQNVRGVSQNFCMSDRACYSMLQAVHPLENSCVRE